MRLTKKQIQAFLRSFCAFFLLLFCAFPFPSVSAFFGLFESDSAQSVPEIRDIHLVSLLVEQELLQDPTLESQIQRYGRDIQRALDARTVLIPISPETTVRQIVDLHRYLYFSGHPDIYGSRLVGTVLVGEVPLPVVDKNGTLAPSIYPYTNLENPVYRWEEPQNRFVFSGGEAPPDIWHGVIRSDAGNGQEGISDKDLAEKREQELREYFETNHKIHAGEITFGKEVFSLDMPAQKKGLNAFLWPSYQNYIDFLEDVVYLRYNQKWAQELVASSPKDQAVPWDMLDPDARPENVPTSQDRTRGMTDVQSKSLIDTELKRYAESWGNYLQNLYDRIDSAQRWNPSDVKTTISLVTQKDMQSAIFLKGVNDTLEKRILESIEQNNISGDVSVPFITDDFFTEQTQPLGRPLYWNGVDRTQMTASECSLLRGSLPDSDHPWAQLVEMNRAYDPDTKGDCSGYAGCCWDHVDTDEDTLEKTLTGCNPQSFWGSGGIHVGATQKIFDRVGTQKVSAGFLGAQGCESIINRINEDPDRAHRFDSLMVHNEPTVETIQAQVGDMNAEFMPIDDPRGFSFYDHDQNWHRFDFLDLFDYRKSFLENPPDIRREKIKDQIKQDLFTHIQKINEVVTASSWARNQQKTQDLSLTWPVSRCEPPSGYGCLDGGGNPLSYDNCRTYTQNVTSVDPFTTRIDWTEECKWQGIGGGEITETEKITRFYEEGSPIDPQRMQDFLEDLDLDRIVDNLLWLDKPIEEKNKITLEQIFSSREGAQDFFFDEGFQGFEGVEFNFESLVERAGEVAFEVGFEQGEFEDGDYQKVLSERDYVREEKGAISFLGRSADEIFPPSSQQEEVLDKDLILYDNPETQKQEIIIPSTFNDLLDRPTSISVTPEKVILSPRDKDAIPFTVETLNALGQRVRTDFETEVELSFSRGGENFRVLPDMKRTVESGKTTFFLAPQASLPEGKISFVAKSEKLVSSPVSLERKSLALDTFSFPSFVVAGAEDGIEIGGEIISEKIEECEDLEGRNLFFHSEWGTFENPSQEIKRGSFSNVFYPDSLAGEGIIEIKDDKGEVFSQMKMEIVPSDPTSFQETSSVVFASGGDWQTVSFVLTDEHGNATQKDSFVPEIEIQGGEIREKLPSVEKGEIKMDIRPLEGSSSIKLTLKTPFFKEDFSKSWTVGEDYVLRPQISRGTIVAGQGSPFKVTARITDKQGNLVQGDLKADVFVSDPALGEVPSQVEFKRGRASFDINGGSVAGNYKIALKAPGFRSEFVPITMAPDEAYAIEAWVDKPILVRGGEEKGLLEIQVVDRYGNQVSSFDGEIALAFNEPQKITHPEIDQMIEKGLIKKGSSAENHLRTQVLSPDQKSRPNDPDLVRFSEGSSVFLRQGKAKVDIEPQEKSGTVYLTLKHPQLMSEAVSFKISDILSATDIEAWEGSAFFTLLTGVGGSYHPSKKSWGESYLMKGQKPAVGTLIQTPSQNAFYGALSPDGTFYQAQKASLLKGSYPTVKVQTPSDYFFEVQWAGGDLASLPILEAGKEKETLKSDVSVYFAPQEGFVFEKKGLQIWKERTLLWEMSSQGGLRDFSPQVTFVSSEENVFRWDVFYREEKIGQMVWDLSFSEISPVLDPSKGFWVSDFSPELRPERGYTGTSTRDPKGILWYHRKELAPRENLLGASGASAHNAHIHRNVGWTEKFKPFAHIASGNTIGQATKWGANEAFLLLGDPTLRLLGDSERGEMNLTQDLGTQIWKAPGKIDQILVGDINGDYSRDIMALSGNVLYVLYRDELFPQRYRPVGPVLRFADGVRRLEAIDLGSDSFTDLLQINAQGEMILHKNTKGTFKRETFLLNKKSVQGEIPENIVDMRLDFFAGSGKKYLAVLDNKNRVSFVPVLSQGLGEPVECGVFSPAFERVLLKHSPTDVSDPMDEIWEQTSSTFLSDLWIYYPEMERDSIYQNSFEAYETDPLVFHPLDRDRRLQAEFEISLSRDYSTMEPGDLIDVRLGLRSVYGISDFQFIAPEMSGMSFVPETLQCEGCEIKPQTPEGSFWAEGINIPPQKTVDLSWQMQVDEIPTLFWEVQDLKNQDGFPEIHIPWQEGENTQIITLSVDSQGQCRKDIESFEETEPLSSEDFFGEKSTQEVQDMLMEPLKKDSDGDGIPDYYDGEEITGEIDLQEEPIDDILTLASVQLQNGQVSKTCEDQGEGGVPMISKVFLAPGNDTVYVPPLSFPGAFDPGTALFWLPPPPVSPTAYTSAFRFYLMPSTTGKVGLGGCSGSYATNIVSPIWNPTCFVTIPKGLDPLCKGDPKSKEQKQKENMVAKAKAKAKKFFSSSSGNQQISSADIFTMYLQNQYREISSMKFPQVTVKKPLLKRDEEEAGGKTSAEKVAESPYFDYQEEDITIPYTHVSDENWEGYHQAYEKWQADYEKWEESAEATINRFSQDLEEIRKSEKASEYDLDRADIKLKEAEGEYVMMKNTQRVVTANYEAVKSYRKAQEGLLKLSEKTKGLVDKVAAKTDQTDEYMGTHEKTLNQNLKEIEDMSKKADKMKASAEKIVKPFVKHSQNYVASTTSRGTMQEWLFRILLGSVELPVYKPPLGPDIVVDLTRSLPLTQMKIPRIKMQPTQADIFDLPPISKEIKMPLMSSYKKDFSWKNQIEGASFFASTIDPAISGKDDLSLEKTSSSLKSFSSEESCASNYSLGEKDVSLARPLPSAPQVPDMEISYAATKVPPLPQIETPELPPSPVDEIEPLIKIAKPFVSLMGILNMGIAPIPEWYMRPYVAQHTNRNKLFDLDFSPGALSPVQTRTEEPEKKVIKVEASPIKALEEVTVFVKDIAETFKCHTQNLRNVTKGELEPQECRIEGQELSSVYSNIASKNQRNWLAFAGDLSQIPKNIPLDQETQETSSSSFSPEKNEVYFSDAVLGKSQKITDFPLEIDPVVRIADLEYDGQKEVVYAVGDEMYLKYAGEIPPMRTTKENLREAYEKEREKGLLFWDIDEFEKILYPFAQIQQKINFDQVKISFDIEEEISYYEWAVSERPDSFWDRQILPQDRKSSFWTRFGFLRPQKNLLYDIIPVQAQIVSIKGNPLGYVSTPQKIENFTKDQCSDGSVVKPFFSAPSILLGKASNSRIEIRVPPREGQVEEFREIVLRSGEQVSVEYAEICVTRGEIEVVSSFREPEKKYLEKGMYLFDGDRLELGQKDEVELILQDGTKTTIHPLEKYFFRVLGEDDLEVVQAQKIPLGNYYGFLQTNPSDYFSAQKPIFLHDPQIEDDRQAPQIIINGGTEFSIQKGEEMIIDASFSKDNDRISDVWWDLNLQKDRDQDGIKDNDREVSDKNVAVEGVRDLLKLSVPPLNVAGTYRFKLWLSDRAGNVSYETITIVVE